MDAAIAIDFFGDRLPLCAHEAQPFEELRRVRHCKDARDPPTLFDSHALCEVSRLIDVGPALEAFATRALQTDLRPAYGRPPKRPGVCYFFPRPSAGSACKRLNLFLRWMVRHDAVDLGVWTRVTPARLIVPLDTHVIRVGRCLQLTRYTSPGWKMAADITAALRQLDPDDPVKYDFSLCHLGMADQCGFNRAQGDSACPLRGLCRPRIRGARPHASGTQRASARPSRRR